MKHNLYPKLAWTGIRKNSRLYLPYILTCIGMVMMFYIVSFLSSSEYLASCKGGKDMQMILELGCGVIGFFAAIFLFRIFILYVCVVFWPRFVHAHGRNSHAPDAAHIPATPD